MSELIKRQIAKRLFNTRKGKGWSQRHAADKLKMHQTDIRRLEAGEKSLRAHELRHVCHVYDIDILWLLGE